MVIHEDIDHVTKQITSGSRGLSLGCSDQTTQKRQTYADGEVHPHVNSDSSSTIFRSSLNRRQFVMMTGPGLLTTLAGCLGPLSGGSDTNLRIIDDEWYEDDYKAGVRGTAINETGKTLDRVKIKVVFLDSDNTQIDDSLDLTHDLKDGRKWKFDARFTGSNESEVEQYEIDIS